MCRDWGYLYCYHDKVHYESVLYYESVFQPVSADGGTQNFYDYLSIPFYLRYFSQTRSPQTLETMFLILLMICYPCMHATVHRTSFFINSTALCYQYIRVLCPASFLLMNPFSWVLYSLELFCI